MGAYVQDQGRSHTWDLEHLIPRGHRLNLTASLFVTHELDWTAYPAGQMLCVRARDDAHETAASRLSTESDDIRRHHLRWHQGRDGHLTGLMTCLQNRNCSTSQWIAVTLC